LCANEFPLRNVYVVRSRPHGHILTVSNNGKRQCADTSYSLAFVFEDDAELVRKSVSAKSRIEFVDFSPKEFSIVSVQKRVDINQLPCAIHKQDFQYFMRIPFTTRSSIGIVHQVLEDSAREILLEVQTFEAIEIQPLMYRRRLMELELETQLWEDAGAGQDGEPDQQQYDI
jgi:hypothetical protein